MIDPVLSVLPRPLNLSAAPSPDEERLFLKRLFLAALLLRAAIALVIHTFDLTYFNGDNVHYEKMGWLLADIWSGNEALRAVVLPTLDTFNSGMYLWVAGIYYLLGVRCVWAPLAINWLLGAANALLIYALAKQLFNRRAAVLASYFIAFLPMFVFWSALLYKEPQVIFFLCLGVWAALHLQRDLHPRYILLAGVALLGLQIFRSYTAYLMGVGILAALALGYEQVFFVSKVRKALLITALVGIALAAGGLRRAQEHFNINLLLQIAKSRTGLATEGRSSYGKDVDISTSDKALRYFPVGTVYLLFAPFPWQLGGMRQNLAIPETLLWYVFVPSTLSGMLYAWRHRRGETIAIFVFTFGLTAFYALFMGNIGTAYRERAQIFLFWFMFAAAGRALNKWGTLEEAAAEG